MFRGRHIFVIGGRQKSPWYKGRMAISLDAPARLSEQELLEHFEKLVVRDRRTTVELLVAIAEIDERKLWAKHACSSMFTFCMERFHMSEQVTAKRLWAARTARRFPAVLAMIERGELHLSAIHRLGGHLTDANHVQLLERAKHKSSRDVERLIAELAPRPDVPSRIRALPRRRIAGASDGGPTDAPAATQAAAAHDRAAQADATQATSQAGTHAGTQQAGATQNGALRTGTTQAGTPSGPAPTPIVPLAPRRYKIEITIDESTHDKLRSLQDLLGRSDTGRDPAAIVARAIDVLLVETLKRKAAQTDRPRPAAPVAASDMAATNAHRARSIPAAVRRQVWQRDCGRCCYVDGRGRRCSETRNVEFHHKLPFAKGGCHAPNNIELRCPAHNQYQADLDFGRSFMDGKRGTPPGGAATFPGECSAATP